MLNEVQESRKSNLKFSQLTESFLKTSVCILVFILQAMSVFGIREMTEGLIHVRNAETAFTHLALLPENKYV